MAFFVGRVLLVIGLCSTILVTIKLIKSKDKEDNDKEDWGDF